jgi:hypothetical protein
MRQKHTNQRAGIVRIYPYSWDLVRRSPDRERSKPRRWVRSSCGDSSRPSSTGGHQPKSSCSPRTRSRRIRSRAGSACGALLLGAAAAGQRRSAWRTAAAAAARPPWAVAAGTGWQPTAAAACGGAGARAAEARGGAHEGGEAARLPGNRWWSPPSASPPQPPPRRWVVWGWRAREGWRAEKRGSSWLGWGYIYTGSEMDLRRQILGVRYGVGRLIWVVGGWRVGRHVGSVVPAVRCVREPHHFAFWVCFALPIYYCRSIVPVICIKLH